MLLKRRLGWWQWLHLEGDADLWNLTTAHTPSGAVKADREEFVMAVE